MKSIIIPNTPTNKNLITLYKIQLLASHLKIYSTLEHTIILTIHNIFKNNPIPNTANTQKQIRQDIIQIIKQQANNQEFKLKEPTISAINNAIWKLSKNNVLIKVDGLYVLNNCFKDIDQVDQIVFRFV